MDSNIILMADMINSQNQPQPSTQKQFQYIVKDINFRYKKHILSPITITLGDEFQGVVKNLQAAINLIIEIEEYLVYKNSNINLRYVIVEGKIETPINKEIAHGMVGEGLTLARKILTLSKRKKKRFSIHVSNDNELINSFFLIYDMFISMWGREEGTLIEYLLKESDYKIVATKLNKTASLIWKRKRSLHIQEYLALKNMLYHAI